MSQWCLCRCGCHDVVSAGLWDHLREVWQRCAFSFQSLSQGIPRYELQPLSCPLSLSWLLSVVVFIGDCVFKCEDLAWVFVCFYHFMGLWSAPIHLHCRWMYKHFCVVLFSLLWYVLPYISLHIAIECFWFPKKLWFVFYCTLHCMDKNTYRYE